MKREPNREQWFSRVEEAELRRLVYRAFALRDEPGYREALEAIETWQIETTPERLKRNRAKP